MSSLTYIQDAGAILVNQHTNHIALVQMQNDIWGFPKGKVHAGESNKDAVIRELYEETGVQDIQHIAPLPTYERPNSAKPEQIIVMNMFLIHTTAETLSPVEDDIKGCAWVAPKDVTQTLSLPKDREYFLSIIDTLS